MRGRRPSVEREMLAGACRSFDVSLTTPFVRSGNEASIRTEATCPIEGY
jgi:hypothetical protein